MDKDKTTPPGEWGLPWQVPREPAPMVSDKLTLANDAAQAEALRAVVEERARQDSAWGPLAEVPPNELAHLLSGNFMEYSESYLAEDTAAVRAGALKVAASALAIVESIDRLDQRKESPNV